MANITTDEIKTISDFPLLPKADIAPADVILVEDISASAYKKASLQDVVDKMNPIQSVNLTTAEYNALSDAQKNNGTYYNITDSESTLQDQLATLSATITALQTALYNTEYHEGDTVTFSQVSTAMKTTVNGFITSGSKNIYMTLPLPKRYNGDKTVTVTSCECTLRSYQEYIGQSSKKQYKDDNTVTIVADIYQNVLNIRLAKSSIWTKTDGTTQITNNTPICAEIFDISFTI